MKIVNLDKMSLDEKKYLIGYGNLSVKDLEKRKLEINNTLNTRASNNKNVFEVEVNYKKLTLIYGIDCKKN